MLLHLHQLQAPFDTGAVGLAAASLGADVTLTDLLQASSSATNLGGFSV